MRNEIPFRRAMAVFVLAAALCLLLPSLAHAQGTGDDPRPTKDVLTPDLAKMKNAQDAACKDWMARYGLGEAKTPQAASRMRTTAVDAPQYYIYTPNHPQERSYWCGPATVQEIDDWWGTPSSQSSIAAWMGTTANGTDFTRVDDALRYFGGLYYFYYGPHSTVGDVVGRIGYTLCSRHMPAVIDANIDARTWSYYEFSHPGHILPVEVYNASTQYMRVNDPYDEAYWMGGGDTLGHKNYSFSVIGSSVMNHWRKAVIG